MSPGLSIGESRQAATLQAIRAHQAELRRCALCPRMTGPPVTGEAVVAPVMLIGQAPGPREIEAGRPFVWTAGRTLFAWFAGIGVDEERFRRKVYMAAVCRCFPGKGPRGGDRVPDRSEIANCAPWRQRELSLLQPGLILPVGKLAIAQFLGVTRLDEAVGRQFSLEVGGRRADLIPLPHPSGASVWHRVQPGKQLLAQALALVAGHPGWRRLTS